VEVETRVGPKE